ncbi:hypothetical protein SADUNF_Sadunf19G0024700 [Salix dunnii]|uniref:Uncharacterized protein n=1 Tax=Salix dunnii TaxID=1413687 RepID=A0A835J0U4_9ROSI|nr:hypothetical protein SADUNF_Sadunf19G0024700 [Salix dunnii]
MFWITKTTHTIFERGEKGNLALSPIAAKLQEADYDRVRDVVVVAAALERLVITIRRDLVQPLCDKKDEAKLVVLEAALAAPKLPVKPSPFTSTSFYAVIDTTATTTTIETQMDMDNDKQTKRSLKPIRKKLKKKLKLLKKNNRGKRENRGVERGAGDNDEKSDNEDLAEADEEESDLDLARKMLDVAIAAAWIYISKKNKENIIDDHLHL